MVMKKDMLAGWTILIVDDDRKTLHFMKELIEFCGADVYTAENGQQGLEQVQVVQPDFIIADLSMPVMDGWQMIEQLKKDRSTAHIPIIALTAHAMVGDRERAIAAGCHNYLSKPLRLDKFVGQLLVLLTDIPAFAPKLGI